MNAPFAAPIGAGRPFVGRHVAARFRILLRQDRYLQRARVDACWVDGFGMAVRVRRLPVAAFSTARLLGEAGPWEPTFNALGETLWATLRDLGEQALEEMAAPAGAMVAVILTPDCIDEARADARAIRAD